MIALARLIGLLFIKYADYIATNWEHINWFNRD